MSKKERIRQTFYETEKLVRIIENYITYPTIDEYNVIRAF